MTRLKKLRLLEFLAIGVIMGTIEDLIAVAFATDAEINLGVIAVVFAVALPFAFLSEIVVDHPRFWEKLLPEKKKPSELLPGDNHQGESQRKSGV